MSSLPQRVQNFFPFQKSLNHTKLEKILGLFEKQKLLSVDESVIFLGSYRALKNEHLEYLRKNSIHSSRFFQAAEAREKPVSNKFQFSLQAK